MVNYGKISMESKKGSRFDISSDTEPQLIFVPSKGNILVFHLENLFHWFPRLIDHTLKIQRCMN